MFFLLHFWCSTLHSMKSVQHFLYNSGKGRCTQYIWSNDIFVLWNRISAIFYKDRMLLTHRLIFDIMNIQNNQSLEFEWLPMLAPLRSVNDWRSSWLLNVFLNSLQDWLSSLQQCQGNVTKDAVQKMLISIVANMWRIKNKP